MDGAIKAGISYFSIVFAIAFGFAMFRVLALTPLIGPTLAVVVEIPVILGVSWISCGWIIRRFAVPTGLTYGALMGALAFALLMLAEFGLSAFLFGRTLAQHIAIYEGLPEQMGLAAQILFAAIPSIQLSRPGHTNWAE